MRPSLARTLWWSLSLLALALTLALYAQADVVFDLATRLWTCV